MPDSGSRYPALQAQYLDAVAGFLATANKVPEARWRELRADGGWSPAQVVLHVAQAYEVGGSALRGEGPGMVRLLPRPVAFFARNVGLRIMLWRRKFPSGARAPREVVPSAMEAHEIGKDDLMARLRRSVDSLLPLLIAGIDDPGKPRFTHAYFGVLPARQVLRLISEHTRHHEGQLARMI
jgi:hypothetical protein